MSSKLTLAESGYQGWPYIHTDLHRNPVMVVWWAKTPTGRQSKYFHAAWAYRNRIHPDVMKKDSHDHLCNVAVPSTHLQKTSDEIMEYLAKESPPDKLPRGYEWQGPFFRHDSDRISGTPKEGQQGPIIVMHRIPKRSENEGASLVYQVNRDLSVGLRTSV